MYPKTLTGVLLPDLQVYNDTGNHVSSQNERVICSNMAVVPGKRGSIPKEMELINSTLERELKDSERNGLKQGLELKEFNKMNWSGNWISMKRIRAS